MSTIADCMSSFICRLKAASLTGLFCEVLSPNIPYTSVYTGNEEKLMKIIKYPLRDEYILLYSFQNFPIPTLRNYTF